MAISIIPRKHRKTSFPADFVKWLKPLEESGFLSMMEQEKH
jgi:hypothetical protein